MSNGDDPSAYERLYRAFLDGPVYGLACVRMPADSGRMAGLIAATPTTVEAKAGLAEIATWDVYDDLTDLLKPLHDGLLKLLPVTFTRLRVLAFTASPWAADLARGLGYKAKAFVHARRLRRKGHCYTLREHVIFERDR